MEEEATALNACRVAVEGAGFKQNAAVGLCVDKEVESSGLLGRVVDG